VIKRYKVKQDICKKDHIGWDSSIVSCNDVWRKIRVSCQLTGNYPHWETGLYPDPLCTLEQPWLSTSLIPKTNWIRSAIWQSSLKNPQNLKTSVVHRLLWALESSYSDAAWQAIQKNVIVTWITLTDCGNTWGQKQKEAYNSQFWWSPKCNQLFLN